MKHVALALLCTTILLYGCPPTCDDPCDPECDSDSPCPDPPEEGIGAQLSLLTAHTWVPGTITKDAVPLADEYPYFSNFTLTFSGTLNSDNSNVTNGTYATNDEGQVLPDGNWEFGPDTDAELLMTDPFNGQTEVEYTVNENSLTLKFTRSTSNGRTEAITGEYIFDLVSQTP
uniref:Lipocalin-like domain-containing protein n=1 Tax=Roseihalotalea indica TaxID=2867963 RepID=A0AA49GT53_9BACT|nr:hypothetical protein K4G66_13365 [Tunicatimonas sp. TK19036]